MKQVPNSSMQVGSKVKAKSDPLGAGVGCVHLHRCHSVRLTPCYLSATPPKPAPGGRGFGSTIVCGREFGCEGSWHVPMTVVKEPGPAMNAGRRPFLTRPVVQALNRGGVEQFPLQAELCGCVVVHLRIVHSFHRARRAS